MNLGDALASMGTSVSNFFVNCIKALMSVFFTVSEAGVMTLEPLGYLAIFGLVFGAVFLLLRWISAFFRRR